MAAILLFSARVDMTDMFSTRREPFRDEIRSRWPRARHGSHLLGIEHRLHRRRDIGSARGKCEEIRLLGMVKFIETTKLNTTTLANLGQHG